MKARILELPNKDARILYVHVDGLKDLTRTAGRSQDAILDAIAEELGEYHAEAERLQRELNRRGRDLRLKGDQFGLQRLLAEFDQHYDELNDELGETVAEIVLSEEQHQFLVDNAGFDKLKGDAFEGSREARATRERIVAAVEQAGHARIEGEGDARTVVRVSEDEAIPQLARARAKRERRAVTKARAARA